MNFTANIVPLFGSNQPRGLVPEVGDPLRGRWPEISCLALLWWNELDDEDLEALDAVHGPEQLARLVQRRFARSREAAEMEVNRFLSRVESLLQAK